MRWAGVSAPRLAVELRSARTKSARSARIGWTRRSSSSIASAPSASRMTTTSGGSAVRCFEEGECVAVVDLPTPLVTCPTFAGPDLDCLVITTASIDLEPGSPGAGDLYVVDAQCRGREPDRLGEWAA